MTQNSSLEHMDYLAPVPILALIKLPQIKKKGKENKHKEDKLMNRRSLLYYLGFLKKTNSNNKKNIRSF